MQYHYNDTDLFICVQGHSNFCLPSSRERKLLKGDIPPQSSGGCGVILGDTLYLFGGMEKKNNILI